MRKFLAVALFFVMGLPLVAQTGPAIYVDSQDGFSPAVAAAFIKKHVPATIVTDKTHADYILQTANVYSKDESGAGKVARCLFLDCIGMNGSSSVSVQLVRTKDSSVAWAYQVRKSNSGPLGIQSLSEAIAKHLKDDFLKKQ